MTGSIFVFECRQACAAEPEARRLSDPEVATFGGGASGSVDADDVPSRTVKTASKEKL